MYPQPAKDPQPAKAPTEARYEPVGVETRIPLNLEPTTKNDWKRLAQYLKPARPEDYPQIDPILFAQFRRGVIKYASGRDALPWLFLGPALTVAVLVITAIIGEPMILVGILPLFLGIIIAGVVHRNSRVDLLGLGWAIGFFKLP